MIFNAFTIIFSYEKTNFEIHDPKNNQKSTTIMKKNWI